MPSCYCWQHRRAATLPPLHTHNPVLQFPYNYTYDQGIAPLARIDERLGCASAAHLPSSICARALELQSSPAGLLRTPMPSILHCSVGCRPLHAAAPVGFSSELTSFGPLALCSLTLQPRVLGSVPPVQRHQHSGVAERHGPAAERHGGAPGQASAGEVLPGHQCSARLECSQPSPGSPFQGGRHPVLHTARPHSLDACSPRAAHWAA